MEKLIGIIEAYSNLYMKSSLTTNLSNISFVSDRDHEDKTTENNDKIYFNGSSAFAIAKDYKKIHRQIHNFNSTTSFWLPIYPLKNKFSECLYLQKSPTQFIFKFITPKNISISDIDFIKTLASCLQQTILNFGTPLSIEEFELPYAFINEIYTILDIKDSIIDINIYANFYQLGKIAAFKFEESENSKTTLSIIKSLFKKSIEINLDQSLWRIGVDSLKIATLEFRLKAIFDGLEIFEHGFCMKLKSIRQLLEIVNPLILKKSLMNAIPKFDLKIKEKLPITEAQKQLVFLCKTENGNDFIEEFSANFNFPLKIEKFKKALSQTLEANPSLKSIFGIDYAKILLSEKALILFTDKSSFENYKFDVFSKSSLIFFIDANKFSMKFHHILFDGKSLQLFIDQLMAFYNGKITQTENPNYFDFAIFEKNFLASSDFSKDIKYWNAKLTIYENFPKLPKESNIYSKTDYNGTVISIDFSTSLTAKLRAFCTSNSVSVFSSFIAFYRLFIYKLYGFTDFPILISIDNRLNESFQNTIGLFINLATVSFKFNPNESFKTLLTQTTKNLTETISHSTLPFNKVISSLRKITSNEPEIPEVMLVHDREAHFPGIEITCPTKKKFIQNPQIWYLKEIGEKFKLQIEFRNALFSSEVMKNQAERFFVLIEKILQNPKMELKKYDFLTEAENEQFFDFRQSLSNIVPIISPIELIFQKMKANPEKIVLKTINEQLTAELFMNKIINYAKKLKAVYEKRFKKQLPPNDQSVALLLQRSIDLITLVFACWYLNLAPLMITPDWPYERIQTSLKGFKNLLLISDNNDFVERHGNSFDASISVISVKSFHNFKQNPQNSPPKMVPSNPTDLAYLTFTSGSTGTPKAVESIQRGLINLWQNYSHYFSISSESIIYQVVNPAFDIFFADIITAFGNGGTLFLASQKIPKMDELKYCTHAYIMPAYLSHLDLENPEILNILKSLKAILYGGETINPNFLKKALKAKLNLFQQFGVTEHSIYSNFISPKTINDRLIVGKNFENFHGYLIDSDGCRLPPINLGIQGWFRSAGIAVARGYSGINIGKEVVFGEEQWFDGWKFFDSGDQMKIIPASKNKNPWNYKFIFCGRNDTQIKIRGNRVELRDIEESFRQHSNINEIVCLFDSSKLLAFITFKESFLTDEKSLREFAQEKLPIYMIPDMFIFLEKFPLNSNGKIDRQKLISMPSETDNVQKITSKNGNAENSIKDLTVICCEIFAKHLKIPFISPEDDVFQKGADSLKLLIAVQEIEDSVGIKLDLSTIFRVRTISKTLELFYQLRNSVNIPLQKEISSFADKNYEEKIHQLSYSQEHLWFLEKLNQDSGNALSDAYILKFQIKHFEELSEKKWNNLIKFLITKHPVLRTQIIESHGIPSQKILKVSDKLVQGLRSFDAISINILNEPPVKFKLFENFKTMEVYCHHISIDGYSLNILINDIETFLNSSTSVIIPDFKYFDFIENQKSYNFSNDLKFFQQKLNKVKDFSFPTEYPRSECTSFKAGHYHSTLQINGFDEFLNKFQISETHFVLAIFAIHQFSNSLSTEISIGLSFANRTTTFLSTVGYFVNAHAISILRPSPTDSFQDFVIQIKETVLEILSHSSTPFELVVRQLKPKREKNKSPIFQQMIIFEDLRNPKLSENIEITELDSIEAKLDQTWRIKRTGNGKFEIHVEFIQDLFKEETIAKSVESFKMLSRKTLESKIVRISDFFENEIPKTIIENFWKEILEIDKIEENSNFFEEGGHSLLAARLTSMINSKLGIKVSLNLLFEHQTLKEYTDAIEKLIQLKLL
uniref:Carrier domain-containing protein n=1 Tax=Panagrolaimus davidi TaxID=227884 RepID=A0A914Q302_9BILA